MAGDVLEAVQLPLPPLQQEAGQQAASHHIQITQHTLKGQLMLLQL
jgi:hypothetical protein